MQEEFKQTIHYPFCTLKSAYEALRAIPQDKPMEINDGLALKIWEYAVNGFIIDLDAFGKRFADFINHLRANHRQKLKRNYWKSISDNPEDAVILGISSKEEHSRVSKELAKHFTKTRREDFKSVWDRLFPSEESRTSGVPCDKDLDNLIEKLRTIGKRVSDHRDTVSAHPDDPNPKAASWADVDKTMADLEQVISEMGLAFFDIGFGFNSSHPGYNPEYVSDGLKEMIFVKAGEQTDEREN